MGIVSGLISGTEFIFLARALYRFLNGSARHIRPLMVTLVPSPSRLLLRDVPFFHFVQYLEPVPRSFADIHSPSVDSVMLHTSAQSGTF
jgi:hypothetical protein